MSDKDPKTGAEMQAMRKRRNFWVLGLIFGLALLFYFVTIFRMGSDDYDDHHITT